MAKHAPYGWIIDIDHLALDEFGKRTDNRDDSGTVGPNNIDPEIERRLKVRWQIAARAGRRSSEGEGRRFQMRDADGELYYSGRLIGDEDLAPLDDFGTPNAGATEIYYWNVETQTWKAS